MRLLFRKYGIITRHLVFVFKSSSVWRKNRPFSVIEDMKAKSLLRSHLAVSEQISKLMQFLVKLKTLCKASNMPFVCSGKNKILSNTLKGNWKTFNYPTMMPFFPRFQVSYSGLLAHRPLAKVSLKCWGAFRLKEKLSLQLKWLLLYRIHTAERLSGRLCPPCRASGGPAAEPWEETEIKVKTEKRLTPRTMLDM